MEPDLAGPNTVRPSADETHSRSDRAARSARVPAAPASARDREHLAQGRHAFERGDDEAALAHLGRVVASGLRFADVHYLIGLVHERRDDLEAACTSLKQALRINPGYVEALIALASVCERRGDYDQAALHAEHAAALTRTDAGGLDRTTRGKLANQQAELADALADAGLQREAIEQYRQALERCPTFHDIRHRLAITLREAGRGFQALQEFERILDAEPGRLESRIQQGLTRYALGNPREAIAIWRSVLLADPTRREAQMYLRLVEDRQDPSDAAEDRDGSAAAVAANAANESPAAVAADADDVEAAVDRAAARAEGAWSTRPLAPARAGADPDPGAADA